MADKAGRGAPPNPLPAPSAKECEAIAEAAGCVSSRRPRVQLRLESCRGGVCKIGSPHSNSVGWTARVNDAFGTTSRDFADSLLTQLLNALAPRDGSASKEKANAVLAVVDGARPNDEIEAMLASQMAVTHALAMDFLGRAQRAEHIPQLESTGSLAVKLLRTYTGQVEALAKLRRGGEQTVRVEHVHVYPGGQAVVGNVNHRSEGGVDRNA